MLLPHLLAFLRRVCLWCMRPSRCTQRPLRLGKGDWCLLPNNPVTIGRTDAPLTHRLVLPRKPPWLAHLLGQALMSTPLCGLCPTDLGMPYIVLHDSKNRQYFFGGTERIHLPNGPRDL